MNNSGSEVLESLRRVRTFCRDVALLLGEAGRPLHEAGYAAISSTLFWDTSTRLDAPDGWFTPYATSIYQRPTDDKIIAYVAVVWDCPGYPALIREPLATSGWVDFAPGRAEWAVIGNPQFLHLHMPGRTDDGNPVVAGEAELKKISKAIGNSASMLRATTLAVPLVDITERSVLISRVVRPLLAELEKLRGH